LFPATVSAWYTSHHFFSTVITLGFVMPLSFLKNIDPLAKGSLICLFCLFYVVCLIGTEFFLYAPETLDIDMFKFTFGGSCNAFSILVMAFISHITALKVFSELRHPTPARTTMVIVVSNLCSFVCYLLSGLFGYLYFGRGVKPNVLEEKDTPPYMLGRVLVALAMALVLPLMMFPARNCVEWMVSETLGLQSPRLQNMWDAPSSENIRFYGLTFAILTLAIPLSFLFQDLDQILGFFGAISASNIVFVFPSLLMLRLQNQLNIAPWEKVMSYFILVVGVLLFTVGTAGNIYTVMQP
jgi:amino acid permease